MPKKLDFRNTWRYRKKPPKYRKPLMMDVKETIPTVGEVTKDGIRRVSLFPGRYEIQITANPDPNKRGRDSKWITIVKDEKIVGMSKRYARSLQREGLIQIFILNP